MGPGQKGQSSMYLSVGKSSRGIGNEVNEAMNPQSSHKKTNSTGSDDSLLEHIWRDPLLLAKRVDFPVQIHDLSASAARRVGLPLVGLLAHRDHAFL